MMVYILSVEGRKFNIIDTKWDITESDLIIINTHPHLQSIGH